MEIDITDFFKNVDTWPLSGSIATHGPNAGPDTWREAKREAAKSPLLKTADELGAMRKWAKTTGTWSHEEIKAWSDQELNALFIQLVSDDMREAGLDGGSNEIDWEAYEAKTQKGQISGNLFKGANDRIYYDLN